MISMHVLTRWVSFSRGGLNAEATLLGQSKLQVMAEQFRKVFFAFNIYRDRSDFYKPTIPLMDFVPAVLFLLGLVLSVAAPRAAAARRC